MLNSLVSFIIPEIIQHKVVNQYYEKIIKLNEIMELIIVQNTICQSGSQLLNSIIFS